MSALRPRHLVFLAALHVGVLAHAQARADEPVAELKIPSAPSSELAAALADGLAKLPTDLRTSFPAVVDAAESRLRASLQAAADGSAAAIGADEAARAAVVAADFGGASKRTKVLDAMVRLTVLQMSVDLHTAMREQLGRRLAVRAVQRCKGVSKCLEKIVPTDRMPARHVTAVRAELGDDVVALANAELATATELEVLGVMYSNVGLANRLVAALAADTATADPPPPPTKPTTPKSGKKRQ